MIKRKIFFKHWKQALDHPIFKVFTALMSPIATVVTGLVTTWGYATVLFASLTITAFVVSAVLARCCPVGKTIEEKAWDAYERGKLRKANKLVEKALGKAKGEPMQFLYMIRGKVYQEADDLKVEAIKAYENAVDGERAWWHFEAYFQLGQLHEESASAYLGNAIEAYIKAVDIGETMLEIDVDDEGIKQAKAHRMMPDKKRMFELCHITAECYEERKEVGDDESARMWLQKEMAIRESLLPPKEDTMALEALESAEKVRGHHAQIEQYSLAIRILSPYLSQLHPRIAEINSKLAICYGALAVIEDPFSLSRFGDDISNIGLSGVVECSNGTGSPHLAR